VKERFHNILSWFAFGSLLLGVSLWGSVLTNQYLNPEPNYVFMLSCGDDEGRDRLERIAAIREKPENEFWESLAEKFEYSLADFTDWDTLIPKDPCASDDPFVLSRIVGFRGTLYYIRSNDYRAWDDEYVRQIPDYNPLKPRDKGDREEIGTLSLIVWGVSITLNYLLFGVFRFLPWRLEKSAEG
jgi:hypothetical protein